VDDPFVGPAIALEVSGSTFEPATLPAELTAAA